MRKVAFAILLIVFASQLFAQGNRESIYSAFALYNKRVRLENDIRENIIATSFRQQLDSNSEYRFEEACNAVSQFLIYNDIVDTGFSKLLQGYEFLSYDTRRAFLEALYAVSGNAYDSSVRGVLQVEANIKLFAMAAVYSFRADSSIENTNSIKIKMVEHFPGYDTVQILVELEKYLNVSRKQRKQKTPDIAMLFDYQRMLGRKVVYSFQRWNRDHPGLAIVQKADGSFVRDASGRLMIFQQLARSASDLPYFITNGSTPQGVYSLQGTAVAKNNYIGPTPNLQLVMPFESTWEKYFQQPLPPYTDSLLLYKQLLPVAWRNYVPMFEVWNAGKIGRTEIIAHGSTIDPEYYKGKPFYPLTPTMGCLCAKELWNVSTGKLLISEQFNLASAYGSSPGSKGYLIVINIDDQQKPVGREEVEALVRKFEKR